MKWSWAKTCVKAAIGSVTVVFIVLAAYLVSLCFREEHIPSSVCDAVIARYVPTNLLVHCDEISIGFRHGLRLKGLRVYDRSRRDALEIMAGADSVKVFPLRRRVVVVGAKFPRLHDGYYAPGNTERNERLDVEFPDLGPFRLEFIEPEILAVAPARVVSDVVVRPHRIDFNAMHLDWKGGDCAPGIDGFCFIDIARQEIYGEVDGLTRQVYIRPLLVALDVPVSLPYMDGFTEVVEPVRSWCSWKVNLVNNDFDLGLELHPKLGRYNGVPMERADGRIHLHSYTRGTCLNYRTTVGPIDSVDGLGRKLTGTVEILGTNGFNEVTVDAAAAIPIASVLKIGGFTGKYVPDDVVGDLTGRLAFRFPRAMTNNYEVLNGEGHVSVENGKLLRLPVFAGLTELLADKVPGISYLVDQSKASADYVIDRGVLKSENIFIEGGVFTIAMAGSFDAVNDRLDFTVRVEFTNRESLMGKYFIRPVTWPFSKLLLEFRLYGSAESPEWEYISVIDRILDFIL